MEASEIFLIKNKLAANAKILSKLSLAFMIVCFTLMVSLTLKMLIGEQVALSIQVVSELLLSKKVECVMLISLLTIGYFTKYALILKEGRVGESNSILAFLASSISTGFLIAYFAMCFYVTRTSSTGINIYLFGSLVLSIIFMTEKLVTATFDANNKLNMYSYTNPDVIEEVLSYIGVPENKTYFDHVTGKGRVLVNGEVMGMRKHWEKVTIDSCSLAPN